MVPKTEPREGGGQTLGVVSPSSSQQHRSANKNRSMSSGGVQSVQQVFVCWQEQTACRGVSITEGLFSDDVSRLPEQRYLFVWHTIIRIVVGGVEYLLNREMR